MVLLHGIVIILSPITNIDSWCWLGLGTDSRKERASTNVDLTTVNLFHGSRGL